MSCDSLVNSLLVKLNDTKGRRYTNRSILIEALNDGICEVWSAYPEQFAQPGSFAATAGESLCLPDCCVILEVRGLFNGDKLVNAIDLTEQDMSEDRLQKPSCLSSANSGTLTAYRSKYTTNCINLDTPLAQCDLDDTPLRLKGTFACRPDPVTDGGDCDWLDCRAKASVINWAAGNLLLTSAKASDRVIGRNLLQLFAGNIRVRKETDDRMEIDDE